MSEFIRFSALGVFVSALFLTGCNHLLYPGSRHAFVDPAAIKPTPIDLTVYHDSPESGRYVHAWYFKSRTQPAKAIALHFHGNGQNLTTHFMFFKWLTDYGYDYIIFDYRGYGVSSDASADQKKTVEDGLAAIRYVKKNFSHLPLITIGQSLGSNVLMRSLQELNKLNESSSFPELVVLDSSFMSYRKAASSVLGKKWFSYPLKPLAYLAIDDDWSAYVAKEYTPQLNALFFHGTQDRIIDLSHGEEAFKNWPGKKFFIPQAEGDHTSAFGDERFKKSKEILIKCIEQSLKDKNQFELCKPD